MNEPRVLPASLPPSIVQRKLGAGPLLFHEGPQLDSALKSLLTLMLGTTSDLPLRPGAGPRVEEGSPALHVFTRAHRLLLLEASQGFWMFVCSINPQRVTWRPAKMQVLGPHPKPSDQPRERGPGSCF